MNINGIEYVMKDTIIPIRQPKFKVGQVVFWGNGYDCYVMILRVHPLHCEGACYSYDVSKHGKYTRAGIESPSEAVLRALTYEELGIQGS